MGVKNGSVVQIDEMTPRQEAVAGLRTNGYTLEEIARELKISVATAHRDLVRVREIWKDRMAQSYEVHVAEAAARLDRLRKALEPGLARGTATAIDAAVRVEERHARLIGLDKPVEQRVTISIEAIDAEIARLKAKRDLPVLEGEIIAEIVE